MLNFPDQISTSELFFNLDNPNIKIIDVRSVDAYNGWKERNEKRGGHIKGAKSLPVKWMKYIDWIEIVRSKKILPEHHLVIYGYDILQIEQAAGYFRKAGYPHLYIYNYFVEEWSADERLPIDRLQRYTQLISPRWLNELITKGTAPEYNNDKFVICHAHYRNKEDYMKGHIPGAIEIDTLLLEAPETWNRRSPEELKEALESLGITYDTTVILYGRFSFPDNHDPFPGSSAGQLAAMRCAFIMLYAGVKDVRVLNGGIHSWIDEGFEISTEVYKKKPVPDFGIRIPSHPEFAVDLPEAREILKAENKNLVCVRSWREYIGEVSGYNYIEKKGRIPGAVFADCGSDAYHMENYRNPDYTMREYNEIEENWKKAGIIPDKFNAFYCGTGWRGSEAFFIAWLMGWPFIALYDGGWFEWSNNNLPFETGVPK
ncbi:MAG TPA: rhodanese-like domain-containing protein [Ignavibacteriaceae bacterium]|nr:rhodanese-like domain-containing protein [Ignavibacteriaceae bacterium]